MKMYKILAVGTAALLTMGAAFNASAKSKAPSKPIGKVTCQDFLVVENNVQPYIVAMAVGYNQKGQAVDEAVDVAEVDTMTPMVVQYCKGNPKATVVSGVQKNMKKKK